MRKKRSPQSQGRHTPKLPPFGITLAIVFSLALIFIALIFIALGRLFVPEMGWIPHAGSLVNQKAFDLVRSATTIAGLLAGVFAIVYSYRKQRIEEAASYRADDESLSKRYQDGVGQLGNESPAVRMAGIYALSRLADEDPGQRATIVKVLCAYLRIPYDPEEAMKGEREVRFTVIETLTNHLQDPQAEIGWNEFDLDFAGVTFDGGSFAGAQFTQGKVSFAGANFVGGHTSFNDVTFAGADVSFGDGIDRPANFLGGEVSFLRSRFTGGYVSFILANFSGTRMNFGDITISGEGHLSFGGATLEGGELSFGDGEWPGADLQGGSLQLGNLHLDGGLLKFIGTRFNGAEVGLGVVVNGGRMVFLWSSFNMGVVDFSGIIFNKGYFNIVGSVITPWAPVIKEFPLPDGQMEWSNFPNPDY